MRRNQSSGAKRYGKNKEEVRLRPTKRPGHIIGKDSEGIIESAIADDLRQPEQPDGLRNTAHVKSISASIA
jgi:hypothetical protein